MAQSFWVLGRCAQMPPQVTLPWRRTLALGRTSEPGARPPGSRDPPLSSRLQGPGSACALGAALLHDLG